MMRRALWGASAAAAFLASVALSLHWDLPPGRVLYDGVVPLPPYRWVHPPAELAKDNRIPEAGRGMLRLRSAGSAPASVTTGDGQATVTLDDNAIAPRDAESLVAVRITALDPARVGPAPSTLRFDGNAYRVEARYAESGRPAVLRRPVTVVLRYATAGMQVVHASGSGWTALRTIRYPGSLQLLVAKTGSLGVFAAVAPATAPYRSGIPWGPAVVALSIAVLAALLIGIGLPALVRSGRTGRRPESRQR